MCQRLTLPKSASLQTRKSLAVEPSFDRIRVVLIDPITGRMSQARIELETRVSARFDERMGWALNHLKEGFAELGFDLISVSKERTVESEITQFLGSASDPVRPVSAPKFGLIQGGKS